VADGPIPRDPLRPPAALGAGSLLAVWAAFYLVAGLAARLGPVAAYASPPFVLFGLTAAALAAQGGLAHLRRFFRWPGLSAVAAGLAAGCGLWLAGGFAVRAVELAGVPVRPNNPLVLDPGLLARPGRLALLSAVAVLLAPAAEEIFYRGILYGWLRARLPAGWSAALGGAAFAAAHLSPSLLPALAVTGAGLALVYERTRSLWPAVAAHATLNALSLAFAAAAAHP
jgi:membrane protease YdiL (CAAX protease family)